MSDPLCVLRLAPHSSFVFRLCDGSSNHPVSQSDVDEGNSRLVGATNRGATGTLSLSLNLLIC